MEHRVYVANLRWDAEKNAIRYLLEWLEVAKGLEDIQICRKEKIGATDVFSVVCMFDG